ncbi:MAG: HAD family hydrolase [Thermoplasmata archaeon]|nr:HAD family hydrolase [Thermoplasmata archaeon]
MRSAGAGIRAIEAVLFDLGGTLIDTRDFGGWAESGRSLGLDVDAESIAAAWESARPWENRREDSPEELWATVLSVASSVEVSSALVGRFLELQRAKPLYGSLFSDVRRCLDRLQRSGKRLAIVSNSRSEPAVRELLVAIGIDSVFETVVSSGTERVRKPDREIFVRALSRLNVQPTAVLFVGDDLENDVRGATRAGLHAIWLNRTGTGEDAGSPEILSLSEVPRIVRLIEAGAPVK